MIQDQACPGCTSCPVVATNTSTDAINFTTKVNCMGMRDQRATEAWEQWYQAQAFARTPTTPPKATHKYTAEAMKRIFSAPPTPPGVERRNAQYQMSRLLEHNPEIAPIVESFLMRAECSTPQLMLFITMLDQITRVYSPDTAREHLRKTHAELLDLCNRLVKAYESAQDLVDIEAAIEELDSLVYEIEKKDAP